MFFVELYVHRQTRLAEFFTVFVAHQTSFTTNSAVKSILDGVESMNKLLFVLIKERLIDADQYGLRECVPSMFPNGSWQLVI